MVGLYRLTAGWLVREQQWAVTMEQTVSHAHAPVA